MKADQSHTEQLKEKLTKEITLQILNKTSWSYYPHSVQDQANEIARDIRRIIEDVLRDKEIVSKPQPLYGFEWTADYKPSHITRTTEKPKNKMLEHPISRFKGFTD